MQHNECNCLQCQLVAIHRDIVRLAVETEQSVSDRLAEIALKVSAAVGAV
jgi:hypothetical protein